MSVRAMTSVWANSRQKGSALLVLLAVADCAHDDGSGAYPSIRALAEKTRLSERNVQYVIKALIASGELALVEAGGGRGNTPTYQVVMEKGAKSAPIQPTERVQPASPITATKDENIAPIDDQKGATQRMERVQPSVEKGATQRQSGGEPLRRGGTVKNRHREPTEVNTPLPPTDGEATKSLPENGPAQIVVKLYCRAAGLDKPADYGRSVGQAQRLLDRGVTVEEVPDYLAWLKTWAIGIDIGLMVSQLDKWRSAGSPGGTPASRMSPNGRSRSEEARDNVEYFEAVGRGEIKVER